MKKFWNSPVRQWQLCVTVLLIGLMQLLGGCSSEAVVAASPAPIETSTVYASASDVALAIGCSDLDLQPGPLGALTQGECTVGSGGVVVATWSDAVGAVDYYTALVGGLIDLHLTTGTNWSANCDEAVTCQNIAAQLNGTYTYIPIS